MSNFLHKIKQAGFYKIGFFAVIGVAAILLLGSIVLTSLNNLNIETKSPSILNRSDLTMSHLSVPVGKESVVLQKTQAQEGQLTQRKIVKNGLLSILVNKIEDSISSIRLLANNLGGFVNSSQVYESSGGIKSGNIVIRVPADKFEDAMAAVKKSAVKVEREDINAQDVTEQFVDLEARLRNFKAQETQYLEIMKKASTVDDILQVEQRLGDVRGQIEQIQGQLQFLSRQVDMSTITVSVMSEADVEVFGIRWRPLFIVKQSFHNMLSGLTSYIDSMIVFIFFLPRLTLWIATILFFAYLAWRLFKWLKPKIFPPRITRQR